MVARIDGEAIHVGGKKSAGRGPGDASVPAPEDPETVPQASINGSVHRVDRQSASDGQSWQPLARSCPARAAIQASEEPRVVLEATREQDVGIPWVDRRR